MTSYEKLGSFYLGRERDVASGKTTDNLTLYDSSDLTTHAIIIGMTGSGKTGLGIDLIEEAAIDKIPVIAIDPKGDMANLLLTFPELRPEDFRPWVDVQAAERGKLAMRLNNLLASPGFEAWRQGVPLDTQRLFYTDAGNPRVSVISIAHLSDVERMFFVSMLLTNLIDWMRAQPGTGSLRALLYMDEVTGYLPPVANPPSKELFLSLLKQARAFGVGVVLATQNPVDLDHKAISNAGTWLIGRLQTERDRARVMDGLEGAATGGDGRSGGFNRKEIEQLLSGLDKRVFYLHNVHEDAPAVFETRWAMSYLAGPCTREQIKRLMDGKREEVPGASATGAAGVAANSPGAQIYGAAVPATAAAATTSAASPSPSDDASSARPVLPAGVEEFFLPLAPSAGGAVYYAGAIGAADVALTNTKHAVNTTRRVLHRCAIGDGALPVDWEQAEELAVELDALTREPAASAKFAPCPAVVTEAGVASWRKLYERWLSTSQSVTLFRSPTFKLISNPGETEGAFRARLQIAAREDRDAKVSEVRKKYGARNAALEERLAKAAQHVEREREQAGSARMGAVVQVGTAIVGMLLGRKRLGVTTASRMGTAIRSASRSYDQSGDVTRAQESAERIREQIARLQSELESEIAALGDSYDAQKERLDSIDIRPKRSDIQVHFVGIGWGDAA